MDDADNPYLPPASDDTASDADPSVWDESVDPRTMGKARYVPVVASLMIVHGILMILVGIGVMALMVFMMPELREEIENQQRLKRLQDPNAPQISKEMMETILTATFGGITAILFLIGLLNIYAGIRNYGYNNRILGVISLVLNMGSILFCWCLPLSIGLLIFGLIIYLSPEADRAFRWKAARGGTAALP